VGKILTYSREAIKEFCEKYFHFWVLLKQNNFNPIVLSEHLFAAISTMKLWHWYCSDFFWLKLSLLSQALLTAPWMRENLLTILNFDRNNRMFIATIQGLPD